MLTFESLALGGGQNRKETKHKGKSSGETPKALLQHLQSMASPHLPEEDPTPQYHTSDSLMGKLCCPICTYLLDRPLEISCGAVVCMNCSASGFSIFNLLPALVVMAIL